MTDREPVDLDEVREVHVEGRDPFETPICVSYAKNWPCHAIRLTDEVRRLREELWTCTECGFTYDKVHSDEKGHHSCPCCKECELEQEIERLREGIEHWRGLYDKTPKHPEGLLGNEFICVHNLMVTDWTKEIKRLRKALEFYADPARYDTGTGGDVARAALEGKADGDE